MNILSVLESRRCLDCGKCTSACPVARYNHSLSPRRIVRKLGFPHGAEAGAAGEPGAAGGAGGDPGGDGRRPAALPGFGSVLGSPSAEAAALWACLTCGQCDASCPHEVPISGLVPQLRARVRSLGERPPFTRCQAMESISVLQSRSDAPQARLDWLPDDVQTDPESKTMLFVGCLPYFDAFYAENGVNTLAAAVGALRILNALGIAPAVLADERCCGHDALWGGDEETFRDLAKRNMALFEKHGFERIVTVCPECSLTLDREYRNLIGSPAGEVLHIAELVAQHAEELAGKMRTVEADEADASPQRVTFQDPCRLGRHQGKYEEPRLALRTIPGLALREMPRSRQRATCCAGSWLSCDQATRRIQADLLAAAKTTGSDCLVTACPKCMIHLSCAQTTKGERDKKTTAEVPAMPLRDLADLLAASLAPAAVTEHQ
jgi:heterodisulfide reductase subunit D